MKAVSKDISVSLIGQAQRPPQDKIVTEEIGRSLSMTMPGDGDVHCAPGRTDERSAGQHVYPMQRFGGTGNSRVPPARSERRGYNRH